VDHAVLGVKSDVEVPDGQDSVRRRKEPSDLKAFDGGV
jgi:hypothetical protein